MLTPQLPLWSDRDATEAWRVRESARARRLTVRVFHTGRVEVVVPARTSPRAVEHFIERHRSWIERKRDEARARAAPGTPFPPPHIELTANGELWSLAHELREQGRPALMLAGPGRLLLRGAADSPGPMRALLRTWITARAREILHPMLDATARELDLRFARMLVRRQRTRWGSCSSRGTISLNCCLLFQRPPVVRYLMVHELVHTVHMNHSRRFWERVRRHCPDYGALDRELLDGWRRVPSWIFAEE